MTAPDMQKFKPIAVQVLVVPGDPGVSWNIVDHIGREIERSKTLSRTPDEARTRGIARAVELAQAELDQARKVFRLKFKETTEIYDTLKALNPRIPISDYDAYMAAIAAEREAQSAVSRAKIHLEFWGNVARNAKNPVQSTLETYKQEIA